MIRPKPTASSPEAVHQIDRFREMAKHLGCDENESAFKAKLAVIARQKPKDKPGRKDAKGK